MLIAPSRCDARTAQRVVPTSAFIDVCDDLFAELLFAGRYAASAGTLRKTGSFNRRTGKETCHHSTERGRRKGGDLQGNDSESSSGAIFTGRDQSAGAPAGEIDPGNIASLCVYT